MTGPRARPGALEEIRGHRGARPAVARTRSIPPVPPRPGAREAFATTWWGDAWVRALEESALDAGRLARGRTYARGGHVGTITVTPGRIAATVSGSRSRPYRTVIRSRVLTGPEWDGLLAAVCAQPAYIAALLDKDMPHALVDAATAAGVRLLPGPGDLEPECSCPDNGRPCKHAAALCYQTARFLDSDPFVLLLLRGRDEEEVLDELARRNAASAARDAHAARGAHDIQAGCGRPGAADAAGTQAPDGVPARDVLATSVRPPLPAPLDPPSAPGEPPPLPELPGAPDPLDLGFLATHAAQRAHAALTSGHTGLTPLPLRDDAIRLAATHPDLTGRGSLSARFARLARESGHSAPGLARAAAAWRQGSEGLPVLESDWDPPAGNFDRARGALAAAGLPRMSIHRNRLTDPTGTFQLRYGRDNRWYPYRSEASGGTKTDEWWPEGPSDADPVAAMTALMAE